MEREGYAFNVEGYERLPLFCSHCHFIGHNLSSCKWLHPSKDTEKFDVGKKPESVTKKGRKQWLANDIGVATSSEPVESQIDILAQQHPACHAIVAHTT